jgi:hypothetical protein
MKSKVYLKYEEQKELVEKYQLQTDFDTTIHYFTKIENNDSIIILSLKKCGTIMQKWTCDTTTIYKKENTEITGVLECNLVNCGSNIKCYLCEQKDIEDL